MSLRAETYIMHILFFFKCAPRPPVMNLRTDERCKEQLTLLSYMFLLVGYCGSAAAVQLYLYYFSPRVNIIYYPCSGRFIDRTDNVEFNYYNRICTYIR